MRGAKRATLSDATELGPARATARWTQQAPRRWPSFISYANSAASRSLLLLSFPCTLEGCNFIVGDLVLLHGACAVEEDPAHEPNKRAADDEV